MLVWRYKLQGDAAGPQASLIMPSILCWPCESIWEAVVPGLPGFSIEVLPTVDSTNAELVRRARSGCHDPVLLVAEQQTAGRGRMGRQWHSGNHHAELTFSLGLPLAPANWSGLSLAVGLCLAQSLHPDIRLKWPNDLWWHGRKLAGILVETVSGSTSLGRYGVVGVGINLLPPPDKGFSTPPAGLVELLPDVDAAQTLGLVAAPLVHTLQRFEQHGFAPFQGEFNARDAVRGIFVTLSNGTQGVAQGVDSVGALRVQTKYGIEKVTSAELSVRPEDTLMNSHFDGVNACCA